MSHRPFANLDLELESARNVARANVAELLTDMDVRRAGEEQRLMEQAKERDRKRKRKIARRSARAAG